MRSVCSQVIDGPFINVKHGLFKAVTYNSVWLQVANGIEVDSTIGSQQGWREFRFFCFDKLVEKSYDSSDLHNNY